MNQKFTKGFALGLSSHSSMQNPSEMFKKSEIFEISSISRNDDQEPPSKELGLSIILPQICRFCGRGNDKEKIVTVCKCIENSSGHPNCVKVQTDSKCKKCKSKWIIKYTANTPELFIQENGSKSTPISALNESSGELRMKNIIKSSVKKPFCRICKEEKETEENKIIFPCQCHTINTKMAWAHRECILSMIIKSQKDDCEHCLAKFSFLPYYEKIWVCSDQDLFWDYLTSASKILLLLGVMISFIVFLLVEDVFYKNSYYQYVWSIILISILSVLILFFIGLLFKQIFFNSTIKIINTLEVLCQKQEIAKMSTKSHFFFQEYITTLRKKKLIPLIMHTKKESKELILKNDDVPEHRSFQPRIILELDTNGENIDSEMLREHSSAKAVSSFRLNNSEDFKEEDIQEFSQI